MKDLLRIICVCSCIVLCSTHATAQKVKACAQTSTLNAAIVQQVKTVIGKKVDSGECWDLAAMVLDSNQCKWNHDYVYGKLVNHTKAECIMPGDLLQFEGVVLQHQEGNTIIKDKYLHHTAVIYSIDTGTGRIQLAQQNTGDHGKIVSIDPFDFAWIQKGKVMVYRATK